jgi:exosortase E/protease (VPEID-CTERM system)
MIPKALDSGLGKRIRIGLGPRLVGIIALLVVEAGFHTLFFQGITNTGRNPFGEQWQFAQHFLFRLMIAYIAFAGVLLALLPRDWGASNRRDPDAGPIRGFLFAWHVVGLAATAALSYCLHTDTLQLPYALQALAWILCAGASVLLLFAAAAPLRDWFQAVRAQRAIFVYAVAPATATVGIIQLSQSLWRPAARLTFAIVVQLLRPFIGVPYNDIDQMNLGTTRFVVNIADACSGLEGVGLMLIFCVSWLWYFRKEYYFPRALIIVPAAMALMFFLNSVRIAALVLIGDAGHPQVAIVGFHSQAGWIAFNLVAFSVAVSAKHSRWLNRNAGVERSQAGTINPVAAYLLPLLAILASGMVAHAMSADFDFFYPLRFVAAIAMLWLYRDAYREIDWRFSWLALVAGAAVFGVWIAFDRWFGPTTPMPSALGDSSTAVRTSWETLRLLASVTTVPIAEELAYRGYLMRVVSSPEFDRIDLRDVRWFGLGVSALVFGITHGDRWAPAIIAGAIYGLVAIRCNRLGEAVAAHAVTNVLIAVSVLVFGWWQLW